MPCHTIQPMLGAAHLWSGHRKNGNTGLGLPTFYVRLECNLTWLGFYSRSLIATFHKGHLFGAMPHDPTHAWCCSPVERAPKKWQHGAGATYFLCALRVQSHLAWVLFKVLDCHIPQGTSFWCHATRSNPCLVLLTCGAGTEKMATRGWGYLLSMCA